MAYLKAEYHIKVSEKIVKGLAITLLEAAKIVFTVDSAINSVEAKILGGGCWTRITRDKMKCC